MTALLRATLVGLNEYGDKRKKQHWLRYARADAEAMGMLLNGSGTFQIETIEVLTNERATQKAVYDSLHHTFASPRYTSNTIALFYFAGHGVIHPSDERVMLCGYDVDTENHNRGVIRLNDIYDILLGSGADCNIAIIDACFSGDIINVQDLKRVYNTSPAEQAKKAIAAIQGREGKTIAIFAACRSDEKARETSERGHGIYTDELLRGWRDGLARDQEGVVSLLGLAHYLSQCFSLDRQAPQFTIRGSGEVVLWRGQPREAGVPREAVKPIPPSNPLTMVGGDGPRIPTYARKEAPNLAQKRNQVIAIASLAGALFLCAVASLAIPVLSTLFFWAFFVWSIALAVFGFAVLRWTLPLSLPQVVLLLGYGYDHFSWRFGNAMADAALSGLAGLEPVYWVLVIAETLLLGILILRGLVSGRV